MTSRRSSSLNLNGRLTFCIAQINENINVWFEFNRQLNINRQIVIILLEESDDSDDTPK